MFGTESVQCRRTGWTTIVLERNLSAIRIATSFPTACVCRKMRRMRASGGTADRSRPKRPCDAKLSLSCREGLPNLAFNQFASTLPPFAASLPLPNSRSPSSVENTPTNIVRCASCHCVLCAPPVRPSGLSCALVRQSVDGDLLVARSILALRGC